MTARPTYLSRIPRGTDTSVADVGARLLGLSVTRQGRNIAGVLEARGRGGLLYEEVVVLLPRRTTKTSSIWETLLGRCATIPGYTVVTTAQDGTRAGEKIREHMAMLDANDFEASGGVLRWSNGRERIIFPNNSVIKVLAPKPGVFRSAAADVIVFDEAGELDPELGPRLLGGALPLMDTRDDPQVIITGTPSANRAGLFWTALDEGRRRVPGVGIVDYSIRDTEELAVLDDGTMPQAWARRVEADGTRFVLDERLLRRVHPGLDSLPDGSRPLTTIGKMRSRFRKMGRTEFEMEYGCRFPRDHTTHAIDPDVWAALCVEPEERPERVGMAFDVAPDGSSASLVYAWRVEGVARVEVAAHRAGTSWLAGTAHRAWSKRSRSGAALAFDDIGANRDPATALDRMRPKPKMDRLTTKDIMAAAQRLASDIAEGRLAHFGQPDLDGAVGNAMWRDILRSGRAFGQRETTASAAPVNPLVAASLALWSYDKTRDRQRFQLG